MSFHTVIIDRKLKPLKTESSPILPETWVEEHWLDNFSQIDDFHSLINDYESLYTIVNGPHTNTSSNAILDSFRLAYCRHHDIVLSPDDMWLLVCLYFSQYVNNNAEKLRSNFVKHKEGKITLTVIDRNDKYNWDTFFDQMKNEVVKNTKNDISHLLEADFSTTGKIESILSTACIMNTFKSYFDYKRMMYTCGIRQVHFMGTLNDWQLLRNKTEQLKLFSDEQFHGYLTGVLPIFDQFIETYKGNVNRKFWIKVCDINRKTKTVKVDDCLSGTIRRRLSEEKITGWVAKLFGLEKIIIRYDRDGPKLPCIRVPVNLVDEENDKSDHCQIVGGFHGIYAVENRYKPVMSLSVIQKIQSNVN